MKDKLVSLLYRKLKLSHKQCNTALESNHNLNNIVSELCHTQGSFVLELNHNQCNILLEL